jgi:hypothetical protein
MVEEREVKELVKKIVIIATSIVNSEHMYKKYFEEYKVKELQYRELKSKLNDPTSFKTPATQVTTYDDSCYTKTTYTKYTYPERNKKFEELKLLKKEFESNRLRANDFHVKQLTDTKRLNMYIKELKESELTNIIEYLDMSKLINTNYLFSNSMIEQMLSKIIKDISILFECGITADISDIYKGSVTLIKILIDHLDICKDSSSSYIELEKETIDIENEISNLKELENNLEKEICRIIKFPLNRIFKKKKITELRDKECKELRKNINSLNRKCSYNYDVLYRLRRTKADSHFKCQKLYDYLDEIIISLGEKSLCDLVTRLNINIGIYKTDDNYFDEIGEMKRILKEWLNNESIAVSELYEWNIEKQEEKQKVLKK